MDCMPYRLTALDLVRGITSLDASQRQATLGALLLVVPSLDEHEMEAIAGALVLARLDETDIRCQQLELLALVELSDWTPVPWRTLNGVFGLDRAGLTATQLAYVEQLANEADRDWNEDSDLWEHQGQAMTAGELRRALGHAPRGVPVLVNVYDGGSAVRSLSPVEVGFTGTGPRPTALVLTVTALAAD